MDLIEVKVSSNVSPRGILTSPGSSGMVLSPTKLNPAIRTYTSGSDPPGYFYDDNQYTIDGTGAETIDLTDLTDVEGVAIDGTNMKLQYLRMQCPTTNSALVGVKEGDTNGYLLGASLSTIAVPCNPGGRLEMEFADQLSDISVTAKTLKFTGSVGDVFQVEFIIG